MLLQANKTLIANSWDQYVSAIIEYYNATSGSTQLSNGTATPGELAMYRRPRSISWLTCW